MGYYCEGVKDWLRCISCERLYSIDCPIQRGDFEELLKQMNFSEPQGPELLFFDELDIDECEGPCGQA